MKVMYWSDYACPYCYIGETHLKKAIEIMGLEDQVDIEMLAFELDPSASKTYTGATVDRFAKISIESRFQALSPGGAISYVEVPNLTGNLEAVLQVMRFIYDNILYAELNTKESRQLAGYIAALRFARAFGLSGSFTAGRKISVLVRSNT